MKLDINVFKTNLGISKIDDKEDEILNSILERAKDKVLAYIAGYTFDEVLNSVVLSLALRMYNTRLREAVIEEKKGYSIHFKEDDFNESELKMMDNIKEAQDKEDGKGQFFAYDYRVL